jgi:hypothetical protein
MDFDRLSEVWRRSGGRPQPLTEKELAVIKEKAIAFDRTIRRRDLIETTVAILLIPCFGWMAVGAPSVMMRAGAAIVTAWCAFIIFWMRRSRRPKPSFDQPVAQVLALELDRVRAQIRLLRSIFWWYLAPPTIGLALLTLGGKGPLVHKLTYLAVVTVLYAGLWWANLRAAAQMEPQAKELEAQLGSLTETEASRG